jgi:predicted Zn-dependent protease
MYIYGYFEDNIDEALILARELTAEFPGSPYYWTMRADLEFAADQYDNAKRSMDTLKDLLPTLSAFSRDEFEGKYLYLTGLYSHHQGNCQSAVAILTKYLKENADEYDFHDINAELIIGRCHEEMLLVQKASHQYKLVANSELPTRMKMEAERALNNL